ncbi:MAG: hypothetical protein AAF990_09170 [Bacteroidota bacterium]
MGLLKPIVDLILYGNFWIALCATALCLQIQLVLGRPFQWDAVVGFSTFGTLFLYAVHRIVGINNLKNFFEVDRYHVIAHFKHHIRVYACIGLIGSGYYFFQLQRATQLVLVLPGLLSLGYVVPFLGQKRKRLRDLDFVKIYLVAIVWAWITVVLPLMEYQQAFGFASILMILERALFIFAITLPFDIRDLKVDQFGQVKTIPAIIGEKRTRQLAIACLFAAALIAFVLFGKGSYSSTVLLALLISYFISILLVQKSNVQQHDYFYSGLMDGTMIFQFLIVYIIHLLQ